MYFFDFPTFIVIGLFYGPNEEGARVYSRSRPPGGERHEHWPSDEKVEKKLKRFLARFLCIIDEVCLFKHNASIGASLARRNSAAGRSCICGESTPGLPLTQVRIAKPTTWSSSAQKMNAKHRLATTEHTRLAQTTGTEQMTWLTASRQRQKNWASWNLIGWCAHY